MQNQASIDEKDSDDEVLTGDGSDAGGMSKKEHNLLKSRRMFRLVEINFPSTIIKAQGVNRLRWDLMIISLAVY